jgi:hypothetical protein
MMPPGNFSLRLVNLWRSTLDANAQVKRKKKKKEEDEKG